MALIDDVANATVRIEFANSRGSGFHFLRSDVIVTNHHVIEGAEGSSKSDIAAVTENNERIPLELIAWSPRTSKDFAILRATKAVPSSRHVLRPKILDPVPRGTSVLFGGFPHGIPHLLVHHASVAGLASGEAFYLEASVNGGNSGGPIVDMNDGTVVGIVTQRRFLGGTDLQSLAASAEKIRSHCQSLAGRGSVNIMGIDFGSFSQLMAEGMLLVKQSLEANANSGIGIGFPIAFVSQKCDELGFK